MRRVLAVAVVLVAVTGFAPPPVASATTTPQWFLRNENTSGFADVAFDYGRWPEDFPVTGDWDGDGVDTIGLFQQGTFYLRNTNDAGYADLTFDYGDPNDWPVAGDWDGDGIDTIGVMRFDGGFYLRNTNTAGFADIEFHYGNGLATDRPLAGDWDGDGTDTIGVRRVEYQFLLRNSNSAGVADVSFPYGTGLDTAIVGDWDGDGTDTVGAHRYPSSSQAPRPFLLRNSNTIGNADIVFQFGEFFDIAIVGDWDGDGVDTVGVLRQPAWAVPAL